MKTLVKSEITYQRLGEVCNIVNGGTPDTGVKDYWDGDILWITPKDMGRLNKVYVDDTERKITEKGLKSSSAKILPINSVILSSRAPIGHLVINSKEITTNQGCKGLIPSGQINAKYLYYFLLFSKELLNNLGSGTTFKELSGTKLAEVTVPVFSLEEQKRIVSILDDVFMDAERAKEIAVTYRGNTLKLYQSSVDKILFQKSASDQIKSLDNVCIIERGSSPRPIKKYLTSDPDGVNWIKIGDTKDVAKYISSTAEKITKKGAEKSRFVDIDDLIISNSMSFGKPYIMKIQGYIHDGWFVLRPYDLINTEYLWYLLVSQSVQTQIKNLASGAIVKNIRSDLIRQVTFPVPALEEQKARLIELNELSDKFEDLEKINVEKVESWDNLKKSVLNKAFRGEL